MTETTILDESAVSEIEARAANRPKIGYLEVALGSLRGGDDAITLLTVDVPALIATVKHLRAENNEYERRWRNQTQRNHTLSQNNRELQSQLEQLRATLAQVEQERDRILQLYNSAWLWVQQRVKHPNSGLPPAAMTLMEMLPLLNQRAIQLCKDKAAEWLNDPQTRYGSVESFAAHLTTELEKL